MSIKVWRDVDNERPKIGAVLWGKGGELNVGRRLYRWVWSRG